MRSVIKEEIFKCPIIISQRAPSPDEVYEKGTTWLHGHDKYIAKKVTVEWEKIE